ncbi:MAG: efflux RND transporter permease subunit [Candidatus Krumholzibacteriota bacterium]|nr:efflux RND transporter permease subunit [Candidatus Krumholzibacteriota bacterium]
MSLTTSSIKYPVSVAVAVMLAVMGGMLALFRVPIQLTPTVQRPVVNVTTVWPGASPEEVEKEIVQKQEKYLKSVEGVLEMTSTSNDSRGTVSLEFEIGTDLTQALVKVTNKLNEVPFYPDDADQPIISTTGRFDRSIAWFVINVIDPESDIYLPHMQRMVEDLVQPRFERVEGVAGVNVFGGLDQEVHVTYDPELLASMNITIPQLQAVLQNENRNISGGDFGEGKRRWIVRTTSRFESLEDIEQTIITVRGGVSLHVGDVATVSLAYQKPRALVRHFARPAIAFNAQSQIGANSLEVIAGLLEQAEIVNREILEPRGLRVENVWRESIYIESAISRVFKNMYIGAALAILTLFLFLRSASSIIVIGTAIPISAVTAFFVMFLFGRTINVISLAGMAFAVGMVVDNSIVVLENIYRHLQMGKTRWNATVEATQEVWGAVLASTLTTVAVFLPIMFVQERAAMLFRDIAIAISSAIFISMVVAITVIPSMSARLLKVSSGHANNDGRSTRLGRLADGIARFVDYVNGKTFRRLITIATMILVTVALSLWLLPPAEYLPNGNMNFVFGFMLPPPGYNIDEVVEIGKTIEGKLKHMWETPEGESDDLPGGGIDNFFFVAFPGQAFMGLRSRDPARARELVPVANQALLSAPGAFGFANQSSLFARGFAGTRSVRMDIVGPELEKVLQVALRVFGQVSSVLPGSSSRPIPGLDLGNPEVRIVPDRARAADVGFSASDIGISVNSLVDGMKVSEYFHDGHEIDLMLKGDDAWTQYTQDISQLPLATPSGRVVTVGDVSDITLTQGPVQINHTERQRVVSIETVLPDDIPLEEAIARINREIVAPLRSEGVIGGLYDVRIAGAADDLTKLRAALKMNFVLVIVLTYLLLSALFQSFLYPLVILLTVPLAMFGGVAGLRIVQLFDSTQQLDVLTMLGFVILVGTVINNSILIVYHALHLMREENMDPRTAVKESVRVRVRPIFMSTSTSVLGMLPLVVLPGAGSELYRGLGSVVVGGLAFSSVLTLVLTPLVFSLAIETAARVRSMLGRDTVAVGTRPAMNGKS